MKSKIDLLKEFQQKCEENGESVTFELSKSHNLYLITQNYHSVRAYIANEFGYIEKIGNLNFVIKGNKMLITYIQSHLPKGEGIGTAMLKVAKNVAQFNNCDEIYLHSLQNAEKFYEKLGFYSKKGKNTAHGLKEYGFKVKNRFNEI